MYSYDFVRVYYILCPRIFLPNVSNMYIYDIICVCSVYSYIYMIPVFVFIFMPINTMI